MLIVMCAVFVPTSALEETDTSTSTIAASSNNNKKKKKFSDASMGLGLEAFQLSDQALQLTEKQILTVVPLPKQGTAEANFDSKAAGAAMTSSRRMEAARCSINRLALKKQQMNKSKNGKQEDDAAVEVSEKVLLAGAVLLQSDEAFAVDPLLLAVPLPIVQLQFKSTEDVSLRANRKGGPSPATVGDSGLEFEHSFPSSIEMASDASLAAKSRVHLTRTLQKLGPETKARFRDPHLLLYLKGLLDPRAFSAVCRYWLGQGNYSLCCSNDSGGEVKTIFIQFCH